MSSPQQPSADALARAWAALLRQTGDVALLVDPAGRVVAASARAKAIFGAGALAPGADVRRLLGLEAGAPLAGAVALPGGQRAELRATPLGDEGGSPGPALLVATPAGEPGHGPLPAQQEQRLREVTLAISGPLNIEEILDRVVRLSIDLIGADAGALPLYDAERDVLLAAHLVNMDSVMRTLPRGAGMIWEIVDSGRSLRNNSYAAEPRALSHLVERQVYAALAVPVAAGAQVLGVLILYHRRQGRQFTARDQELLEIVGRQAGVAIQNARLYAAAVRDADRRMLLYKASVSFGSALSGGDLYAAIHRAAASLVPCDSFAIGLLDAERGEIEYAYMADAGRLYPPERAPLGRGLLGYVIRNDVSLRITNAAEEVDSMFGAEDYGDSGNASRSILAVVLTVADKTIGAITAQAARPDAYTPEDLDAMETLAATAAIALQNAQLFAKVNELATRDALTSVYNRRHFFALARQEIERATRYHHPVSLVMIDADYFKQINDSYGHMIGDLVLQAIASRCRDSLREVDVVARYGGEEFLALLPETGAAAALQAAHRLHDAIGGAPVATVAGPVPISVSIGVASFERDHLGTVDQLLDHVDRALYEAKRAGRNQIRAYLDPGLELR